MRRHLALALALAALGTMAPHAARANTQTFVLGVASGIHGFATEDDLRAERFADRPTARYIAAYGEWYALDTVGFGVRYVSLGASAEAETTGAAGAEQTQRTDLAVDGVALTAHWVPVGAGETVRIGLRAGAGPSVYAVKVTTETDTETTSRRRAATGYLLLGGAYVDIGPNEFGLRLGVEAVQTRYGRITVGDERLSLDAGGASYYVGLRWAM